MASDSTAPDLAEIFARQDERLRRMEELERERVRLDRRVRRLLPRMKAASDRARALERSYRRG